MSRLSDAVNAARVAREEYLEAVEGGSGDAEHDAANDMASCIEEIVEGWNHDGT